MAEVIRYTFNAATQPADPDESSTIYTGAIPYPIGGGYYKARRWSDEGIYSAVTSKSFEREWTPANTTTALWLDANDVNTITKDGSNLVSQWNDKSGNGKNATASGTNRPLYSSSRIVFDGSDDYMQTSNVFTSASDVTVFIVHRAHTIGGTGQGIFSLQDGLNSTNGYFHTIYRSDITNNLRGLYTSDGSSSNMTILNPNITLQTNTDYIMGHGASASTHYISTNGTYSSTSRTAQCNFSNAKGIIGIYYSASYPFDGEICEICVLPSLADTTLRQKFEGYLAWKWDGINGNTALVTALPVGHPYKSAPPTV